MGNKHESKHTKTILASLSGRPRSRMAHCVHWTWSQSPCERKASSFMNQCIQILRGDADNFAFINPGCRICASWVSAAISECEHVFPKQCPVTLHFNLLIRVNNYFIDTCTIRLRNGKTVLGDHIVASSYFKGDSGWWEWLRSGWMWGGVGFWWARTWVLQVMKLEVNWVEEDRGGLH